MLISKVKIKFGTLGGGSFVSAVFCIIACRAFDLKV